MKFAFERQRRLKEAELKTDEDALNSQWADTEGMKRSMLGMGDVRFK